MKFMLELGLELCKMHQCPQVYFWLAEEGWRECLGAVISENEEDPEKLQVAIVSYGQGFIVPEWNMN